MLKLQPASLAVGVVFGLIASLVLRPEGSVTSRECQSAPAVREREARLKRLEIEVTALRDSAMHRSAERVKMLQSPRGRQLTPSSFQRQTALS